MRAARKQEDRGGIDVVVQTDVGRVFLQVKRSHLRADEWLREHADDPRPIGLVVTRETAEIAVVYGRVLGVLILLRERLQQETAVVDAAE